MGVSMATRDEFEKWYASKRDWYVTTEAGWECWQASRAAALEEAAKVCDRYLSIGFDISDPDMKAAHQRHGWVTAACAKMIRALAKSEGE
jgi:hypothetical protein